MSTDRKQHCQCVFPGPDEQEMATIPGPCPGTSLRVSVQAGPDGFVRLEQLAFNAGLGWYVQKSFCIPGEALGALVPHLRKAQCLMPQPERPAGHLVMPPPHLRLHRDDTPEAERREA